MSLPGYEHLDQGHQDVVASILPMIEEAKQKGMLLRCTYDRLLFTPDGLIEQLKTGSFCWGPINWILEEKTPASKPNFCTGAETKASLEASEAAALSQAQELVSLRTALENALACMISTHTVTLGEAIGLTRMESDAAIAENDALEAGIRAAEDALAGSMVPSLWDWTPVSKGAPKDAELVVAANFGRMVAAGKTCQLSLGYSEVCRYYDKTFHWDWHTQPTHFMRMPPTPKDKPAAEVKP